MLFGEQTLVGIQDFQGNVKASRRDVSSEFVFPNVGAGLVAATGQSGDSCFDQVLTDTAV